MQYNFDYFISYAHKDNVSEDGKPGFVDEFVEKLQRSTEHQQMFGGDIKVFFDKTAIHNMSDWDNRIRSSLASSRFLIVLLSPGYFKSEYCAREFDWWMQHEMHRRMLGEGTAPMLIVDVAQMYDYQAKTIPDIPAELQARFPNWLSQIRKIQSGQQFDMRELDRAKISEALDSLRNEVKDRVQRQDNAEKSPNNALYPRYNENFVGRRENLRSLRQNLSLSEQNATRFVALTGLGGFGKTELALTYGHAFAWDYQLGRVFVNCENKTSLIEILLTSGIAEMNGWELPQETNEQQLAFLFNHLEAKREEIVQQNGAGNLNALGGSLLLILDNVNRLELISQDSLNILPKFFHVVITTRESTSEFPYIHTEPVDRLSEDESVELLSNLRPFGSDESEITAAHQIAQSLDGFTLVVELTGAYLARNPNVTYQQQYERMVASHPETFQVMADRTSRLTRHSAQTVAAVLESTLSALSDNACDALVFASLMAPDAVGFGWLPELVDLDEDEGQKILDELTGYSLLSQLENEPNIARIHRLVAETVKKDIPEDFQKEICEIILNKCYDLLIKDETFWCTPENSWNITPVFEFCMTLAEQWTVEASEQDIDLALTYMLHTSGDVLNLLGKINESKKAFQQRYKMSEERAKTFPDHLNAQRELSISYGLLGNWEEAAGNVAAARELYEKALEINMRLADLAPKNVDILRDLGVSYNHLGNIEIDTGNDVAARKWYKKALEICQMRADLMSNNIDTQQDLGVLYSILGDLEQAAGNFAAAREWYEKKLAIDQKFVDLMPNDVNYVERLSNSYNSLGNVERSVGNAVATREWYKKAMDIRKRLADQMPYNVQAQQDLSDSYHILGDLEIEVGRYDAARNWYKKALGIQITLTDLMPNNFQAQQNLNVSYERLGSLEFATENITAARDWYKKSLEIDQLLADKFPDHIGVQRALSVSYNNLGYLELIIGNYDAARDWYLKALEYIQQLSKKQTDNIQVQRDLSTIYNNLGYLEIEVNDTAAAKDWNDKALIILNHLVEKDPNDIESQLILGKVYRCIGDSEAANNNIQIALDWYKKAIKVFQLLIAVAPDNVEYQQDLVKTQVRINHITIRFNKFF